MKTLSKRLLHSCRTRGNLVATAITLLIALLLVGPSLEARELISADVKIKSITATIDQAATTLTCTVAVHNDNDDDAQLVKLLVTLPLEVQFRSASVAPARHWAPCDATVGGNGGIGNVNCELGGMGVGETVTLTIVTTAPVKDISHKSCGAFVWSKVPDPDRSNNYKISVEP